MEHWREIQETVQKSIKKSEFITWIAPLDFDKIDLDTLYINAPTRFIADWARRNFLLEILNAAKTFIPNINEIKFSVRIKILSPKTTIDTINQKQNDLLNLETRKETTSFSDPLNLNIKYNSEFTFDSFIKDSSNNLAYDAIEGLTTDTEVKYNPLFIHSPSGFGKTHLLNALSNKLIETNPTKKIIYTSSNKFLYSFIKAVQEHDTYRFKQSFKDADILLIDDIQFIAGKEATAKELFHIIDEYIEAGKQVVITANNSPYLIEGLDHNIKSRIASGLILDISPAPYDLRLKILNSKSEKLGVKFDSGIAEFIASKINSSIRELEGAVKRIAFHSKLKGDLTLHEIRKILSDILAANTKPIEISDIKKIVAEKWNISLAEMDGNTRSQHIIIPRHIAMYIAKNLTTKSLPEIGKSFGGRNHATIINAVKKVKDLILINPNMANLIKETEYKCSNI